MEDVDGARSFDATGESYDSFMGRYSKPLAECFADAAGVRPGHPSPAFGEACRSRYTGVGPKTADTAGTRPTVSSRSSEVVLDHANVLGFFSLAAGSDVELHGLAFVE